MSATRSAAAGTWNADCGASGGRNGGGAATFSVCYPVWKKPSVQSRLVETLGRFGVCPACFLRKSYSHPGSNPNVHVIHRISLYLDSRQRARYVGTRPSMGHQCVFSFVPSWTMISSVKSLVCGRRLLIGHGGYLGAPLVVSARLELLPVAVCQSCPTMWFHPMEQVDLGWKNGNNHQSTAPHRIWFQVNLRQGTLQFKSPLRMEERKCTVNNHQSTLHRTDYYAVRSSELRQGTLQS